nr:LuxR family transcriptional regulator [Dactylosporangium thailandense]
MSALGAAALGGPPTAVLLCGEAGAGKSRLAEESVERLVANGRPTARVTASASLAQIPLGALVALLGSGPGGSAALGEVGRDPLRLFALARDVVLARGTGGRLLLFVDNLPLLDAASVALVAQLLHAGLADLLATLRAGEPLPDAFLALWSGDRAVRVDVPLLSRADCDRVLAAALGAPVAARSAAELHRASGGNVLFLRELVLGARAAGTLVQVAGVWRLSAAPGGTPALRDLIAARLRGLDPAELTVLQRLALCQGLAVDELPGPDDRRILSRLDEAGLVGVEEMGERLFVRLAHPQYAPVITAGLSRLRAADLLLEQVARLEPVAGEPADQLRVAIWRLSATGSADPGLLLRAARVARAGHDFATVERLVAARDGVTDDDAPEALLLLGEAQRELGRPAEALATLQRAAELPASARLRVRIATVRAAVLAYQHQRTDAALAVLREARRAAPGHEPALVTVAATLLGSAHRTAEALAELAAAGPPHRLGVDDRARWAVAAARAYTAAGRGTDALAAADTAVALTNGDATPTTHTTAGHSADALAAADTTVAPGGGEAGLAGQPHRAGPLMVRAEVLADAGRIDEGIAVARVALVRAVDDGVERVVCSAEWWLARNLLLAGRPRSAARWCRDVVSGARVHELPTLLPLGLAGLTVASAWLGDAAGAAAAWAQLAAGPDSAAEPRDPWLAAAEAWCQAVNGDARAAVGTLVRAADAAVERGHVAAAAALLHDAARLGQPGVAAAGLARLAEAADSPLIAARAACATAAARRDDAGLTLAAEWFERQGALLFAAEAAAAGAQAARAAGSARRAAALLARAAALAARCEGAATPALALTEPAQALTQREREIATLAAGGLTSRDIAQRLRLSVRTVNNHLQAGYGKLGITGRDELHRALGRTA